MGAASAPFIFDPIAMGELLEKRASRTDSGNLRPGSRSLLEQVRDSLDEQRLTIEGYWKVFQVQIALSMLTRRRCLQRQRARRRATQYLQNISGHVVNITPQPAIGDWGVWCRWQCRQRAVLLQLTSPHHSENNVI